MHPYMCTTPEYDSGSSLNFLQMEVNMSMLNIANSLQSRQDSLGDSMRAIKQQLDSLTQNQQGDWF